MQVCFAYDCNYNFSDFTLQENEINILKKIHILTVLCFKKQHKKRFQLEEDLIAFRELDEYRSFSEEEWKEFLEDKERIVKNFLSTTTEGSQFSLLRYSNDILNILNVTKDKIKIFSNLKKFYLQESKKIIVKDLAIMHLLESHLKGKQMIKTFDKKIIRIFKDTVYSQTDIFPFCSNYKIFLHIIDSFVNLNKINAKTTGRVPTLQRFCNYMAIELASFYFLTYQNFSPYSGLTGSYMGYCKQEYDIDYQDPLFLALTVTCYHSLAPCLARIGHLNGVIPFSITERPLKDYNYF